MSISPNNTRPGQAGQAEKPGGVRGRLAGLWPLGSTVLRFEVVGLGGVLFF